jgi:hypothetical protein
LQLRVSNLLIRRYFGPRACLRVERLPVPAGILCNEVGTEGVSVTVNELRFSGDVGISGFLKRVVGRRLSYSAVGKPISWAKAASVVDQDRRTFCFNMVRAVTAISWGGNHVEVVVVVAGDGEVPHPAVVDLRRGAAVGDRDTAVRGRKMLAGLEVTGG